MNEGLKNKQLSSRDKKASTYRRVVAGNVNGKSIVQSDELMEAYQFKTVPGYEHTLVWINDGTPDPSKAGFYSILLFVPAHTTIQGHSHRDDRMATVVSGAWYFGYGDRFDAKSLKKLPPGSVYSEPGGHNHFARTDKDAVIVQISGYGPTDTRYFNPADEPKPAQ